MGLDPPLIATLLGLLACSANLTHGCNVALEEIIRTLNTLSERKTPCFRQTVADVFAVPQSAPEAEVLGRALAVLRQAYQPGELARCLAAHRRRDVLGQLRQLYRNLHWLAPRHNCPVDASKHSSWKVFLESLKRTMQKKYSECGSSTF